ncbi:competence transcription factor ComK [Jeotgalicoccus pinnipedialis]|nr:competence transcription factor ComK [Jeotgalicoccus pinnipedialis]
MDVKYTSRAVFTNQVAYSTKTTTKWVDDTLKRYYATNIEARKYHAKIHFNVHRLTPIIFTTNNGFLLFPLPEKQFKLNNYWINLSKCYAFKESDTGVIVEFTNGSKLDIPISITAFERQYTRALFLNDQYGKFVIARDNRNHMNYNDTIIYNMSNSNE